MIRENMLLNAPFKYLRKENWQGYFYFQKTKVKSTQKVIKIVILTLN